MEPAGPVMAKIFRELLARVPAEERPVYAWPAVCGVGVANRTRALYFFGGVLKVEVPDRAWKVQLTQIAPRYVAEFAKLLGEVVQRVEFVMPGEVAPEPTLEN